jgi:hypothetical protein
MRKKLGAVLVIRLYVATILELFIPAIGTTPFAQTLPIRAPFATSETNSKGPHSWTI